MEISTIVSIILIAIPVLSTITSLAVQGVKKLADELDWIYAPTAFAAVISMFTTLLLSIIFCLIAGIHCSWTVVGIILGLMFLTFLGSTIGYDNVKKIVEQAGPSVSSIIKIKLNIQSPSNPKETKK